MQHTHIATIPTSQVSALFADRALSFPLSKGATFADLAERLNDLCVWHAGLPTSLSLTFGAVGQPAHDHQAAI
jgi:hypothetical protein